MKPILELARQKELCELVAQGATLETAAAMVGCTESTIRNTVEQDLEFRRCLEVAEAEMMTLVLETLQRAAKEPGNWRAAARWMEYVEAIRDPIDDFLIALIELEHQVKPHLDKLTRKKISRQVRRMIDELTPDDFHTPWKSIIPKQP